jgi:Arc/MetJ-type ribon-helix-helix transcriptional regulator
MTSTTVDISVSLPSAFAHSIDLLIARGHFANRNDVMTTALALLQDRYVDRHIMDKRILAELEHLDRDQEMADAELGMDDYIRNILPIGES